MMRLNEQISLEVNTPQLVLKSTVTLDDTTREISKAFDYDFNGSVTEIIEMPNLPPTSEFNIGLIVGSSGSGKSTLLKTVYGEEEVCEWDNTKSIASHFKDAEEASQRFGAVGLNSIPTWLKPFNVLSTGEKFRAEMARRLKDNAVIDEFTSVVNREVAISCSCSISKYIKANDIKGVVFCSCHKDIIPYLQPNWVYNTDTHEFYNGRYLQRPQREIEIQRCGVDEWDIFRKYHYLSGEINNASVCYEATLNGEPIAFIALLSLMGRDVKHAWREHRLVVLPDFQGMGVGNKLSEAVAQAYIEKGCTYYSKTANPRMGEHRDKSPLWKATSNNHKAREDYVRDDGTVRSNKRYAMNDDMIRKHAQRVCYSHQYIGDGTKYPYTYTTQSNNIKQLEGQIELEL